jgi:osmotically-inducible protein OsmY
MRKLSGMPSKRSYDDIARTTVPLPDSSHRPTSAEESAATDRPAGPRIHKRFADDDTVNIDSVKAALLALDGADLADLDLTIEGGRVEIDGSVADDGDRDRIIRAVSDATGVIAVIDTIRIRAH